ncbi:hypothetical protein [Anaerotignum propionicum]|uniref:hypothetical protein n=1 Tax=Anaerotignum propionicum TaxID=28446 RepID=UPI0028975CB9|nr:hypothetical protein [Anaerotignum propionicum]
MEETVVEVAESAWTVVDVQTLLFLSKISVMCLFALIAIMAILVFAIGYNSKNH